MAAGTIKFEDALVLVHKRGMYMQEAVPVGVGAMAALLGAEYEAVAAACERAEGGQAQIANWNSPEQIVISGHKAAVEHVVKNVKAAKAVMLPVSAPFHSALMKGAEERLAADLDAVEFRDPEFPVITNVDARMIRTGAEARDALKRQVSRPVLWTKSMDLLAGEKIDAFVEFGAGKVLCGLIKRIGKGWPHPFTVQSVEDPESLEKATPHFNRLFAVEDDIPAVLDEVFGGRVKGHNHRQPEPDLADDHQLTQDSFSENEQGDGHGLQLHFYLARPRGGDDDPFGCGDRPEAGHRDLAADDNRGHPGRNPSHADEADKSRGHEELVGDRVEKLPEGGDFIRLAGQQPVYGIG